MLQYIIQPGDTLYFIALKFNTTVKSIMEANQITDPNGTYVGQVIRIPISAKMPKGNQSFPLLSRGSTGPFVFLLQSYLAGLGYYQGAMDGVYGPSTEGSVVQFQLGRRLIPNGTTDYLTWKYLLEENESLSHAPPFQAKMIFPGLFVLLSADKKVYNTGESIRLTLMKLNLSPQNMTLHYISGQRYDFKITYLSGRPLWRWSDNKSFIQALGTVTLSPNQSVIYTEEFTISSHQSSGFYHVFGWNAAKQTSHHKLHIPIQIKQI